MTMNEKIWFGKPKLMECSHCRTEKQFYLDKYEIKYETSFLPGKLCARVDLNYRCCDCNALHPLFNSRDIDATDEAKKEFRDIIESNKYLRCEE